MMETEVKFKMTKKQFLAILSLAENKFGNSNKLHQEDILFEHPLLKLAKNGIVLRLRKENSSNYLTWKGKDAGNQKYKIKKELEMQINDRETLLSILSSLGFRKNMQIRKTRHEFSRNNCKVCFDEVKGLGFFLEIEGQKKDIESFVGIFDLEKKARVTKGYAQLIMER